MSVAEIVQRQEVWRRESGRIGETPNLTVERLDELHRGAFPDAGELRVLVENARLMKTLRGIFIEQVIHDR